MKILIACEESQTVCSAFRMNGHEAYSCDIMPCSGDHPEWHIQCDVTLLLKDNWDMVIAFPPCTDLCNSGAKWFKDKKLSKKQQSSVDFFMQFVHCSAPYVCIENPIGIMSSLYRNPDQIIHPWMFGDPYSKSTCLWLKNLCLLKPTFIVEKNTLWISNLKKKDRSLVRSKTFPGIASAMAEQWNNVLPAFIRSTLRFTYKTEFVSQKGLI